MINAFAEDLRDEILSSISEDEGYLEIDIQEVTKNNGNTLTGLVFKGDSNISPVIYVDGAYKDYSEGRDISDIADSIINTYRNSLASAPKNAEGFWDFSKNSDKLFISAMNADLNSERLSDTPYMQVEDIALTVRMQISQDSSGIGTVLVNNDLLELMDVDKDTVFEQALVNSKLLHPPVV